MTVFNIQHEYEKGLLERVSSLFTVTNDASPIKRVFDKETFLGSPVGSALYNAQDDGVQIDDNVVTVKPNLFESKKVVPRQMVMFNNQANKVSLLQSFIKGIEYNRFMGGVGDDDSSLSIVSPFYDVVVNENVDENVVVEESSFLNAYSKLNKVGIPYIVFNPNIDGVYEEVKKFLDVFPHAIASAPSWLQDSAEAEGIKGFVTTTGAMTLGKFTDPIYSQSDPDVNNEVTLRYTNEMFGLETFRKASAIIGTPKTPEVPVDGITLSQKTATMNEGATKQLTATVTPEDATDKTVTWSSSDEGVATVNDGLVTAVAAGSAVITATASGHEAKCNVTVNAITPPEE